ncbi:MAG: hexokinase [Candidatus Moranbacteria bacterium]|nr:hexokinase [Candidatus Moranbacteria bacterium]
MKKEKSNKQKILNFFKKNKIQWNFSDSYKDYIKAFIQEMNWGLAGKESSLAMLPSYIKPGFKVPIKEKTIVLDAGGTNIRTALISFNNKGGHKLHYYKKTLLPGAAKEISKNKFFEEIYKLIEPIIDKSNKIGFCFSYPMEKTKDCDGRVLAMSKEMQSGRHLIGQKIGENLKKTLKAKGLKKKFKVVLLNDTVATLLAGNLIGQVRRYKNYAGVIWGTGINACYIEKNENIKKIKQKIGSQIINTEFGNFDKFQKSKFDKALDKKTQNQGFQHFEKMVAGAYFGSLCLEVLKQAAKENVFSKKTAVYVIALNELLTKDVNNFIINPFEPNNPLGQKSVKKTDKETIFYILSLLIERSIWLMAISIASVVLKTGDGLNPLHPLCINLDGYTVHAMKGLKGRLENRLYKLLTKKRDIYFEIIQIDHSPLIGAGIAGLVN